MDAGGEAVLARRITRRISCGFRTLLFFSITDPLLLWVRTRREVTKWSTSSSSSTTMSEASPSSSTSSTTTCLSTSSITIADTGTDLLVRVVSASSSWELVFSVLSFTLENFCRTVLYLSRSELFDVSSILSLIKSSAFWFLSSKPATRMPDESSLLGHLWCIK